ncbi:hypothetical protein A3860_17305 [Niastella vici]|uniref:ParB/Sulfiredoxin domain-containing protein n=1 Tax=Niastella vici TaxID=1703345 RepID=A0A1V9G459_9BACT|nr:hypothetical protein [Niastella vici]OQP65421.1 hypothetical protein A3860_17305 [Niastella vici]
MSAFLKYDLIIKDDESYESFKSRCLDFLKQVTVLADAELMQLTPAELVTLHSINYARYLALMNPQPREEYIDLQIDQLLCVPFYRLYPRNMCDENWKPSDWDLADPGATQSERPIEVKVIGKRKLVIHDGHNRLKDLILSGSQIAEVKVVEIRDTECLLAKAEIEQILNDPNIPEDGKIYAEELLNKYYS